MENGSSTFYLSTFELPFTVQVFIFLPMYIVAVLANLLLITTVALSSELHKPMYVFLCNLAMGDIIGCTSCVPRQLHILLTGDKQILFASCVTQMFWINIFVSNEFLTLAVMSVDRYAAICYPLHYHNIVTTKRSIIVLLIMWTISIAVQLFIHLLILRLKFKVPYGQLQGMFCDHAGILRLSYSDTRINELCGMAGIILTVSIPLCAIGFTYYNILRQCVKMKSKDFNKKTLYTLVTHFSALTVCFSAVFISTMVPRFITDFQSVTVRNLRCAFQLSVFVVPISNALIYFFRTKELRRASIKYCQKILTKIYVRFGSHKVWANGD